MLAGAGILMVLLALAGCSAPGDHPGFSGGGSAAVVDGDDSGVASDGGGDGGSTDAAAPVITEVQAAFYSPPNLATVIEAFVYWDDPQGDVDGGKVVISVSASDGTSLDQTLDIDGTYARLDTDRTGSPVTFWLSGVNTGLSYTVDLSLKDAAGHASNSMSATVP